MTFPLLLENPLIPAIAKQLIKRLRQGTKALLVVAFGLTCGREMKEEVYQLCSLDGWFLFLHSLLQEEHPW